MLMKKWLRLLLATVSEDIAADIQRQLTKVFQVEAHRVATEAEFNAALHKHAWDCCIIEHSVSELNEFVVLDAVRRSGMIMPVIVLSDSAEIETVVEAMKAGASDYMLKANSSGLVSVVEKTLKATRDKRIHNVAQERVRQFERRLGNLMETLPIGILVLNMSQAIVELNQAMVDMFGYSTKEELILVPRDNLYFDPEDKRTLYDRLGSDGWANLEVKMRRKDETLFWVSINSAVKTIEGAETYIISIFRDISERKFAETALKHSEERFRLLFEQNEDATLIIDCRNCTMIDANPAAVRLYGFERLELISGGASIFMLPKDYEVFEKQLCGMDTANILRIELSTIKKDGSRMITSIRGQKMSLEGYEVVYCTFMDITERVRLQEESRVMQLKLIQSNKMASIGLISSGVAHEINNPTNYILLNSLLLDSVWVDAVEILEEYYRNNGEFSIGGVSFAEMRKAAPELIKGISSGARRIKAIVDDMKTLARTEQRQHKNEADVNQAVQAAVSLLKHQIDISTDFWSLTLAPDLPKVRGSTQKIEQVMINLIMNALQALSGNQCAVSVITSYEEAGPSVLIKVMDDGIGISSDVLPRISEPFFTTKLEEGGTGLGLAITYAIIHEYGGTIDFESGVGKGTTVYVRLPVILPAVSLH